MLNEVMVKVVALTQVLRARFEQEEGQGLVEYALIIALVSVALIAALGVLAGGIDAVFAAIADTLRTNAP